MAATQTDALAGSDVEAADSEDTEPVIEEADVGAEVEADAATTEEVGAEDIEEVEPPRVGFFRGASPAEIAASRDRLAAAPVVDDAEADDAEPAAASEADEPVSAGPQPEEPVPEPAEEDEDGLQSALDELAAVLGEPTGDDDEDAVAEEPGHEEQSGGRQGS